MSAHPVESKTRQRRKETRPGEIVEAAFLCFSENGFEATRIDQVARCAGISKGTIYIYFRDKEGLFRAVVKHVTSTNLKAMATAASAFDGPAEEFLPSLLLQMADNVAVSRAPTIARLILRELDRFPELGRIWFDEVASPMLTAVESVLSRAQDRGEVRQGNSRLQAFSVVGPMVVGILFSEVMERLGLEGVDLTKLADEHGDTLRHGLLR